MEHPHREIKIRVFTLCEHVEDCLAARYPTCSSILNRSEVPNHKPMTFARLKSSSHARHNRIDDRTKLSFDFFILCLLDHPDCLLVFFLDRLDWPREIVNLNSAATPTPRAGSPEKNKLVPQPAIFADFLLQRVELFEGGLRGLLPNR